MLDPFNPGRRSALSFLDLTPALDRALLSEAPAAASLSEGGEAHVCRHGISRNTVRPGDILRGNEARRMDS